MLNPSLTAYNELQTLHAGTLKCACSVTAIPYESFTLLSALSHQVCSSDFASDRWLSIHTKTGVIELIQSLNYYLIFVN